LAAFTAKKPKNTHRTNQSEQIQLLFVFDIKGSATPLCTENKIHNR
jgi:hypothetical protein